jgi:hypothetical protein
VRRQVPAPRGSARYNSAEIARRRSRSRMPALKLFISHSSRLDDVAHRHPDDDANWRLLREVCEHLRRSYGETVDLLGDMRLRTGDDWTARLNVWLQECHAAVFLFSRRALDRSHWVAKEASILSWRNALESRFQMIAITIEGESRKEELAQGFFGCLDFGRIQVSHAAHQPQAIAAEIVGVLGTPDQFAQRIKATPLELLIDAFAARLGTATTERNVEQALDSLAHRIPNADVQRVQCHGETSAGRLTRRLLEAAAIDVEAGFKHLSTVARYAQPGLAIADAQWMFKQIRPLWVNAGAAAYLRIPSDGSRALALHGRLLGAPCPENPYGAYTLERYLQRAYTHVEERPKVIRTTTRFFDKTAAEMAQEIIALATPWAVGYPKVQGSIRSRRLVLLIQQGEGDPVPDERARPAIEELLNTHPQLLLIFAVSAGVNALPLWMRKVAPELDSAAEERAYDSEHWEWDDLRRIYEN